MSALNLLTQFSISSISPIKFNSFSISNFSQISCNSRELIISGKPNFPHRRRRRRRRRGLIMGEERVFKIQALDSGDSDDINNNNIRVLEQESLIQSPSSPFQSSQFESTLNRLSKWLVAAVFGAVILWRHDPEAVWAVMGSILNSVLSVVLKRVLNQERPASNLRSGPGMPSSHAQSIFFAEVFVVLSLVESLGVNEFTLIVAALSLALGSYFSWLRVAQQYHTVSQVAVGAVIGFCFSLLWMWSWDAFVSDAFTSLLWVRISILLGSAFCCLGFLVYVILNWFTDDR